MKNTRIIKQVMEITQGFSTKPCAALDEYEPVPSIEAYEYSHDATTEIAELRLEAGFHVDEVKLNDHLMWSGGFQGKRGL